MQKTVYLIFNEGITDNSVNTFMDFTSKSIAQYNPEVLYYLFSSSGGAVNAGVTLFNFLKALPQQIVMHNMGSIDSIANAIFLAADERYAAHASSFLLHGISWNFAQGSTLSYTQMQETLSRFDSAEQITAKIIGDNSNLTPDEVRGLFLQGESKNPEFALDKGIIHQIRDIDIPPGAPIHSILPGA